LRNCQRTNLELHEEILFSGASPQSAGLTKSCEGVRVAPRRGVRVQAILHMTRASSTTLTGRVIPWCSIRSLLVWSMK